MNRMDLKAQRSTGNLPDKVVKEIVPQQNDEGWESDLDKFQEEAEVSNHNIQSPELNGLWQR